MGIGNEVKQWREAQGLTQEAVAKAIESTQPHYSEFERGKAGRWLSDASALLLQRVSFGKFKASDLVDPSRRRRVSAVDGSDIVEEPLPSIPPGITAADLSSAPGAA